MGKKYMYRNGEQATILTTERPGVTPVVSMSEKGDIIPHRKDGGYNHPENSGWDLIEVTPFCEFKIDDKVMVRDGEGSWKRMHFAGVTMGGRPMVFNDGGTSWSFSYKTEWDECRSPTEDELRGYNTG